MSDSSREQFCETEQVVMSDSNREHFCATEVDNNIEQGRASITDELEELDESARCLGGTRTTLRASAGNGWEFTGCLGSTRTTLSSPINGVGRFTRCLGGTRTTLSASQGGGCELNEVGNTSTALNGCIEGENDEHEARTCKDELDDDERCRLQGSRGVCVTAEGGGTPAVQPGPSGIDILNLMGTLRNVFDDEHVEDDDSEDERAPADRIHSNDLES